MSKLDDAIAVMFEERGGQSFAFGELEIIDYTEYHTTRGRKVWVFRKDSVWASSRPSSGSGETTSCPSESTGHKPNTKIIP